MSAIDHAETAREVINEIGFPHENGLAIAHAQVHATLALVEQQRIANMQRERDELSRNAQGRTDPDAQKMSVRADALSAQIRAVLL